mmetsp:Transcript_103067/g.291109  ORF Transcript_103067/g.291109 Transcript_103067/m.291109 type:complete len:450 (-) Transcript_103067:1734-3083(-)
MPLATSIATFKRWNQGNAKSRRWWRSEKTVPPAQNSEIIKAGAACVDAPMKSTRFGWRSLRRTQISRVNSTGKGPELRRRFTATSVPCQVPRNTSAVLPLPSNSSTRSSAGSTSHSAPMTAPPPPQAPQPPAAGDAPPAPQGWPTAAATAAGAAAATGDPQSPCTPPPPPHQPKSTPGGIGAPPPATPIPAATPPQARNGLAPPARASSRRPSPLQPPWRVGSPPNARSPILTGRVASAGGAAGWPMSACPGWCLFGLQPRTSALTASMGSAARALAATSWGAALTAAAVRLAKTQSGLGVAAGVWATFTSPGPSPSSRLASARRTARCSWVALRSNGLSGMEACRGGDAPLRGGVRLGLAPPAAPSCCGSGIPKPAGACAVEPCRAPSQTTRCCAEGVAWMPPPTTAPTGGHCGCNCSPGCPSCVGCCATSGGSSRSCQSGVANSGWC